MCRQVQAEDSPASPPHMSLHLGPSCLQRGPSQTQPRIWEEPPPTHLSTLVNPSPLPSPPSLPAPTHQCSSMLGVLCLNKSEIKIENLSTPLPPPATGLLSSPSLPGVLKELLTLLISTSSPLAAPQLVTWLPPPPHCRNCPHLGHCFSLLLKGWLLGTSFLSPLCSTGIVEDSYILEWSPHSWVSGPPATCFPYFCLQAPFLCSHNEGSSGLPPGPLMPPPWATQSFDSHPDADTTHFVFSSSDLYLPTDIPTWACLRPFTLTIPRMELIISPHSCKISFLPCEPFSERDIASYPVAKPGIPGFSPKSSLNPTPPALWIGHQSYGFTSQMSPEFSKPSASQLKVNPRRHVAMSRDGLVVTTWRVGAIGV